MCAFEVLVLDENKGIKCPEQGYFCWQLDQNDYFTGIALPIDYRQIGGIFQDHAYTLLDKALTTGKTINRVYREMLLDKSRISVQDNPFDTMGKKPALTLGTKVGVDPENGEIGMAWGQKKRITPEYCDDIDISLLFGQNRGDVVTMVDFCERSRAPRTRFYAERKERLPIVETACPTRLQERNLLYSKADKRTKAFMPASGMGDQIRRSVTCITGIAVTKYAEHHMIPVLYNDYTTGLFRTTPSSNQQYAPFSAPYSDFLKGFNFAQIASHMDNPKKKPLLSSEAVDDIMTTYNSAALRLQMG